MQIACPVCRVCQGLWLGLGLGRGISASVSLLDIVCQLCHWVREGEPVRQTFHALLRLNTVIPVYSLTV